ncbi:hypothetical protein NG743_10490 [Dolichospermum heterosporum TAC447]|uniref:Uncharacterized protein n=1 Tax=Dolichospermum heterosporum TAC447 TaxID=747523 RepID=A0ABY5M4A7_9CYAN|nr:hypothetical protein NG743_10490 [Dolichospermum heterosporum TAC447]
MELLSPSDSLKTRQDLQINQ